MKTLAAFYDLAVGPVSFDVVAFLVKAQMAAEARRCCRLHVVIVPDPNGVGGVFRDKLQLYDLNEMQWRLWNIVIPACQLAGATVTLAASRAQALSTKADEHWPDDWRDQSLAKRHHLIGPLIEAAKAGAVIPRLTASAHALAKVGAYYHSLARPVVTMTRRQTYDRARNSDAGEWDLFERQLRRAGYAVVTLHDTAVALEQGSGFGELNLDLRMACYQLACQNVIGLNGPAALLWFSGAPFAMFDAPSPGHAEWPSWEAYKLHGAQLPWATPQQRIFYDRATADHMAAGFKQLGLL